MWFPIYKQNTEYRIQNTNYMLRDLIGIWKKCVLTSQLETEAKVERKQGEIVSEGPWGWSFDEGLHLFVFLQWDHTQMGRVLQHHFGHQVTSNRPGLEFSCLLPNESTELSIIVFWPAVFHQPALSKLNGPSRNLGASSFDAGSSEEP